MFELEEFPVASGRLGLGLGLPDCLPATVSPLPAATYSATVSPKPSTLLQVPLQILCRIGEKALIKCQKGFSAHCSLVSTGFNMEVIPQEVFPTTFCPKRKLHKYSITSNHWLKGPSTEAQSMQGSEVVHQLI